MKIDRTLLPKILADPILRRQLMIRLIIALQAREGIQTTEEQAARAYDRMKRNQAEQSA